MAKKDDHKLKRRMGKQNPLQNGVCPHWNRNSYRILPMMSLKNYLIPLFEAAFRMNWKAA